MQPYSMEVLRAVGGDGEGHVARQLTKAMALGADLVLPR